MKLHKLPKTTARAKKRVGRGYGSGKGGHTSGRGQKGQKARSKVNLLFEGSKMRKTLIKRLPMYRGKLKFKTYKIKTLILNVKYLNLLPANTEVTLDTLVKHGLLHKQVRQIGVKILGDGELTKKLIVKLPVSKGARQKIEKAGGKVIEVPKVSEISKVSKVSKTPKAEKPKTPKNLKQPKQPKAVKKQKSNKKK